MNDLTDKQRGTAARVMAGFAGADLSAAWQALHDAQPEIAGFIDNKVTPKAATAILPPLAELERQGVEKNSIRDGNPVTVIFNDGSALILCAEKGLRDPQPPRTYAPRAIVPQPHVDIISSPLL